MRDLTPPLEALRRQDLYRSRRLLGGPQSVRPVIDGRRVLSFCSNDYLGLAADPRLAEALADGARRYGVGSGAAHLITGHAEPHARLEDALAAFVGRPRALLFSTGYMANLGVITALVGRGDQVLADRLNHASLLDGARLSDGRLRRYPHADASAAMRMASSDGAALLATDGVFSMDGDLAPLPDLAAAARRLGARLLVDDAHGLGIVGATGRGTLEHFGLDLEAVPVLMGTLGKAFGTFGAFVAGDEALIETLIQRARSYIYTTALPPALAEATLAALDVVRTEDWRRARLRQLVARFRAGAKAIGLPLVPSTTPIQPLLAGEAGRALAWARALEADGVLVTAIRPPTVPRGSARLRITLSAAHDEDDVDRLLDLLCRLPGLDRTGETSSTPDAGIQRCNESA